MNHWLLSRYAPDVPYYEGATWTSISDIGESFPARVLTLAEYLRAEDLLVGAVMALHARAGSPALTVAAVDKHRARRLRRLLRPGSVLSSAQVAEVVRGMLREECGAFLSKPGVFSVGSGFDMHLYVGSCAESETTLADIERSGLFVVEGAVSGYESD